MSAASSVGTLCLQGGRELTPPCETMDAAVLTRCSGRVVVIAGAARVGSDYAGASARTVSYYGRLGVSVDTVPDPRTDVRGALTALDDGVGLVVLPGGSPGGLLDVLTSVDNGSIGRRLIELWGSGTALSGASAGAMVLCANTVRPDSSRGLTAGLSLVDGVAVPHWTPGSERRWALPDGLVWGLPECGGVLVDDGRMSAVGEGNPSVRIDGEWHRVSRSGTEALPA